MAVISFERPDYLYFLFVIPFLVFLHFATLRIAKSRALRFANFEAIGRIKGIDFFSKNIVVLLISALIVMCVSLSMAEMTVQAAFPTSEYSFVIALDNSQSMGADDVAPTRFSAAQEAAIAFIDEAPFGTSVGIISFSGSTIIEQPVRIISGSTSSTISGISLSDVSGTDLVEAVFSSVNLLTQENAKAIIMLSDGQQNVGALDEAIGYARDYGVVVHTIAVGTEEGGQTSYGLSRVDEESLRALSYATGGQFFRADDSEELKNAFRDVVPLTQQVIAIPIKSYLLSAALLLFVVQYFLVSTRYRRIP